MNISMWFKNTTFAAILAGAAFAADEAARFHHFHLNVVDPEKSIKYYDTFFGSVPVTFRGISKGLLTDRSFILLNKVDKAAPSEMISSIYHLGWGGVDGPSDFKWRDAMGIKWETPVTALGTNHYMYAYGPDNEVVEIWTGFKHYRFGHVHLFSDDVKTATEWYVKNLGLEGPQQVRPRPEYPAGGLVRKVGEALPAGMLWASAVESGGVTINIFATPRNETLNWWNYDGIKGELVKTDGRVVDHIAFSYRDIGPAFERMKANGVEIVDPMKDREEYGIKSFFVRGPDGILIEIVEARPIPEGLWETD